MDYSFMYEAIDDKFTELSDIAYAIWETPEVAFKEKKASGLIADALEKYGFSVSKGCYGVPTAVKGVWGEGHPVIGLLAEYDALPDLSQKLSTEHSPVVEGDPGHGCGHNIMATACLGAAIGMKAYLEKTGLKGTVVYYGCPAEEVLTGKPFMARAGAFKDLDVALAWHGGGFNGVAAGVSTAVNSAVFHFEGLASHAGGAPWAGRSALDAAELMNVAANYLREHIPDGIRMHYSYKEAGGAPNIVPAKASVWYYVRALSRDLVEDTFARLVKCAEGAAIATETKLSVEFLGGCYETMPNMVLSKLLDECLREAPMGTWTEDELEYADKLNKTVPTYEKLKASGKLSSPLAVTVNPISTGVSYSSTDVGDVMHICPCAQFYTAMRAAATVAHSWQVTACSGMSIGFKGSLLASKVMALAAAKMFENNKLVDEANAEFKRSMGENVYKCPIPDDVKVPQ